MVIMTYSAINLNIVNPVVTRSTVNEIKIEAEHSARDIALSLGSGKGELKREDIQGDLLSQARQIENRLDVLKLKIYTKSGNTIYSSDPRETGETNRERYFTDSIAKGVARTNLLRKDIEDSEGKKETVYIVRTNVPILIDGSVVGALETYYNIKNRIRGFDRQVRRYSTFLFVVGFALMVAIILMAFIMAKTEDNLKKSQKDMVQAKKHLESLIESSTDAIVKTDKAGKVVLFNKGAEALTGYRREEVIGRQGPVLYESVEDAKEVMRRMREGGGTVSAFETTFRAKEGARIPVLISASILYDEEGQEVGAVGFSKDLRERKRAQEQLIRSEKMASVGLLTAGVSHEILNPLNVITLRLHTLISNPDTPPEVTRYLRIMEKHANRITKITRDLLSFSRQRTPENRLVDLSAVAKHTLALMEHDLMLENIEVELMLAEGLPKVMADLDQLEQVVLNLLTNARDAMPDGGRLTLITETVQANAHKLVELRVKDTGNGIASEHLERLFDPFFTTKPDGKGTGLGLAICQGIVETHGGAIWAENVNKGGTVFVVQLAAKEEEEGYEE
jgi:PAS domain S-box-containing protein